MEKQVRLQSTPVATAAPASAPAASAEPAAKPPRKTKLDRVQDLLTKAHKMMVDFGLDGGSAEDHVKGAIAEIATVQASGFKLPRRSKKDGLEAGATVWIKPEAVDEMGIGDEWKAAVEVVNITEKKIAIVKASNGMTMGFKLAKVSLKDPAAGNGETASA